MKTIGGRNGTRQYVLQSVIGQGSFGKVYYSYPFAIKQVIINNQPSLKQAIRNQVDILRELNHSNIVKLIDIVEQGYSLYIVMEYCEEDMSQYLRKNKLDEIQAICVIKQILTGLGCLVQKGFIHRDLKPANILVKSNSFFKLADFGLAKHVQEYQSNLLHTIAGTPLYMAPQILKKASYTTKCDIWSAGIIFYELLVGKLPWRASDQKELYINITTKPLMIPTHLSDWSKTLLSKMLVVNENERIGWEQLFEFTKQDIRSKSRGKERATSAAKSESNISDKSPIKTSKDYVTFPANKLKDLLFLDLKEYFDEWTCNKIIKEPTYKLNPDEIIKVKEILNLYNGQLQYFYLQEIGCFKCIK